MSKVEMLKKEQFLTMLNTYLYKKRVYSIIIVIPIQYKGILYC